MLNTCHTKCCCASASYTPNENHERRVKRTAVEEFVEQLDGFVLQEVHVGGAEAEVGEKLETEEDLALCNNNTFTVQ